MKSILLVALGMQLAFGNLCLMPMAHAQMTMDHESNGVMSSAHCPDCTDVSSMPAHCPGGHCVIAAASIEENATPVTGTMIAVASAPIETLSLPAIGDDFIDTHTAAPPPQSPIRTIILQL